MPPAHFGTEGAKDAAWQGEEGWPVAQTASAGKLCHSGTIRTLRREFGLA
jgi:hypothetical protein